ncbi:LOW QUALITY PROTEIN: myosin light chain kinase 2, skeletal/cardiac muscle [Anguilla rostrata]|uniref:LOW QUALITY PROTEIN: myosin light chain kinase 2, skeletal/cardiac muscle n=1 Tax=Anguilla rostrata TaxID=7938 RepID=UPI0030D58F2C
MSSSLVSKLAKVYDSKMLQQKHAPAKQPADPGKPPAATAAARDGSSAMETGMESLSEKMDRLMSVQETVLGRLQDMSQDVEALRGGRDGDGGGDVTGLCREMSAIMSAVNQRSEQQSSKLEGVERLVVGIQQVIGFIGETVKGSRLMELVFNRPPAARKAEKPAKPAAKEKPPKPAAKEKPPKLTAKEKPTKLSAKEKPAKLAAKEKPTKLTAKEKPAKPAAKEKPAKLTAKEKPAKLTAKEKPAKPAAKEKPAKLAAKEKPSKPAAKEISSIMDKPVEPISQEKPTMFDDKGRKAHKRKSLIDMLREQKGKDVKEKARSAFKGLKSQKKKKPPDADTVSLRKQALLLEEVQKLNQQNAERSGRRDTPEPQGGAVATAGERAEVAAPPTGWPSSWARRAHPWPSRRTARRRRRRRPEAQEAQVFSEEQTEDGDQLKDDEVPGAEEAEEEEEEEGQKEAEEIPTDSEVTETEEVPPAPEDMSSGISPSVHESFVSSSCEDPEVGVASSKRRVTQEDLLKDDLKKSRVEEGEAEEEEGESAAQPEGGEEEPVPEKKQEEEEEAEEVSEPPAEEYVIDCSPPPLAPFEHRIVAAKPHTISNFYTINREEILGGGRFGQVHKCVENSSGLTLAAKIIKARSQKEKEVVRNEIQVMNQLDHANLIQLYAAYESRHDIILVMEYVDGGELFDRIIDENYNLTELDTVLFIRQITEGLQYMHQMYILHLDLKPENILCVSRSTNKIKIIDFGLARRYKPREKLRVNFGTPEFLAPEVINYEFVSFPTDMWSLGVITYMLLSGLSPFLGEDDNETLNSILACQWSFEEEEFADISEEAKDFITRLLVKSKSWRMSATESLKHPWLSDRRLHYRLQQKGNKCHSTHAPPPES